HLAHLLARMPSWFTQILSETKLELAAGQPYTYETTEDLLALFDRNVGEARTAISRATDADYDREWSLTMGDTVVMKMSRDAVVRQTMNHLSHHRGQMTVYLR